jgi:hypothetical protein
LKVVARALLLQSRNITDQKVRSRNKILGWTYQVRFFVAKKRARKKATVDSAHGTNKKYRPEGTVIARIYATEL